MLCEWMKINVIPESVEDRKEMEAFCSFGCNIDQNSGSNADGMLWTYEVMVLPFRPYEEEPELIPILAEVPFYGKNIEKKMSSRWKQSVLFLDKCFTAIIKKVFQEYMEPLLKSKKLQVRDVGPYKFQNLYTIYENPNSISSEPTFLFQCGIRFHPIRKAFEFHKDDGFMTATIILPPPGKLTKNKCISTEYLLEEEREESKCEASGHEEERMCSLRVHSPFGGWHRTPSSVSSNRRKQRDWNTISFQQKKSYWQKEENNNNPFLSFLFYGLTLKQSQTSWRQFKIQSERKKKNQQFQRGTVLCILYFLLVFLIGPVFLLPPSVKKIIFRKMDNISAFLLSIIFILLLFIVVLQCYQIHIVQQSSFPLLFLYTVDYKKEEEFIDLLISLCVGNILLYSLCFFFIILYFIYLFYLLWTLYHNSNNLFTSKNLIIVYFLYLLYFCLSLTPFFLLFYLYRFIHERT
jgi:hypothetical protein